MSKIIEILRLKNDSKLSHQKIALAVGLSKGAIAKYVSIAAAVGIKSWPIPDGIDERALERRLFPSTGKPPSRYIEPDWFVVHQELKRKGVTLLRLWGEHEERVGEHAHRYTQFSQRYRAWKLRQKRSMRQHHRAGEKVFIDHCGPTMPVIDRRTGELRQAQIFVAVLGASSYTYAEATWTQGLEDWIGSNTRMLEFFGGVPELLIPDNLRAASTKACRYEPQVNETYLEFARHNATAVLPTRPRKPKDKSKVENGVSVVERWILARLRNIMFFSLGQLNEAIAHLLILLNERPFKKLPGSRRTLFEQIEKDKLVPLPSHVYEYQHVRNASVHVDYHIEYDKHYYSVPHMLTGSQVEVRATNRIVNVYASGKRVACHARSTFQSGHTTLKEQMPQTHRHQADWTPERFTQWALDIGPSAHHLVDLMLKKKRHPQQSFRSVLALLSLAKQYDRVRLERACTRAMQIGSPTRTSVQSILKKGIDNLATENQQEMFNDDEHLNDHDNVRGADYYH